MFLKTKYYSDLVERFEKRNDTEVPHKIKHGTFLTMNYANYTVVLLFRKTKSDNPAHWVGIANCMALDDPKASVGIEIALWRALEDWLDGTQLAPEIDVGVYANIAAKFGYDY